MEDNIKNIIEKETRIKPNLGAQPWASYANAIFVSNDDYMIVSKNHYVIYIKEYDVFEDVKIESREELDIEKIKIKKGDYYIGKAILERYNIKDINEVVLYKLKDNVGQTFEEIRLQSFKKIKNKGIYVSESIRERLEKANVSNKFIIYNKRDFSQFVVSLSKIFVDDSLQDSEIGLTRQKIVQLNLKFGNVARKENICDEVSIVPLLNKIKKENENMLAKMFNKLLDFYIGKSSVTLVVKSSILSDQNFDVVRISKSNLGLLGISDLDKVNIYYKEKMFACSVLPILDIDKDIINKHDVTGKLNQNMIVCMPDLIREELGIPTVAANVVVNIERNTLNIWNKNINKQILPIILILFTSEIFIKFDAILLKILFSILALPIVLFFNLSDVRTIVSRKSQ